MAGLRERKKRATRTAIRDAGMRLFAERGFAGTTIDQIAEAADVSRATVFSYFPTKEDIVFGDAPFAVAALAGALRDRDPAVGAIAAVRTWLAGLGGWIEPELVLQLRLMREVPTVAARRLRIHGELQAVIAVAIAEELGEGQELAAQLAAAALVAALAIAEEDAAARMATGSRALTDEEVDRLLDDAVAFAEAGTAALRRR